MNDYGSVEEYAKSCIDNDLWRYNRYKSMFRNKKVLDFGCGLGGLVSLLSNASHAFGYDIDRTWIKVNSTITSRMYDTFEEIPDDYFDYITLFHVLEHIKDPKELLKTLTKKLNKNGKIIGEVPSANDALLTLYDNNAFQNFSYWSCHLYLFNAHTVESMVKSAGFSVEYIKQIQRYPLANHLYWLAKGKPNGQNIWEQLNDCSINKSYELLLAKLGLCDTILFSIKENNEDSTSKT